MGSGAKVLLVDGDRGLSRSLKVILEGRGFTGVVASDGPAALVAVKAERPDVVLIGADTPGPPDALEIVRTLKSEGPTAAVPVIVLASGDQAEAQVQAGFQAGADDYLVKPIRANELFARIQVSLWRLRGDHQDTKRFITVGPLELDLTGRVVRVQGERVELTLTEFEILKLLITRAGQSLTREQILDQVAVGEPLVAKNVDVHLSHIRRKLNLAAGLIETVRGVGYRFRDRPVTHH